MMKEMIILLKRGMYSIQNFNLVLFRRKKSVSVNIIYFLSTLINIHFSIFLHSDWSFNASCAIKTEYQHLIPSTTL